MKEKDQREGRIMKLISTDNEFISDKERSAFYVLAEALRKHINKYEVDE